MSDPFPTGDDEPAPIPITNIEAEAALLGAMMIDNRVIDDVMGKLGVEDFYEPMHARIFELCCQLRLEGKLANPVTLRPFLRNDAPMRWIEKDEWGRDAERTCEIGAYTAVLTGNPASLIGARAFADQLSDLGVLRRLEAALLAGLSEIRDTSVTIDPAKLAADASSEILRLSDKVATVPIRSGARMMRRAAARSIEIREGVSVGAKCASISDLNEMLGHLGGGEMTVIGGRPSMGKSLLLQSALWGYALNGHGALGFSLEMSDDALALRAAADLSFAMGEPIPYSRLLRGQIDGTDEATLAEIERRLEEIPFHMTSPGRGTIEEMEAMAMRHAAALARKGKKLQVLGFDYIQIVNTKNKKVTGREKIDFISERILALAKRLDCAAIVLSQLSRGVEARPDKRPQTSDLKESGRLEEDATNVVLVFRPEFYLGTSEPKDRHSKEWAAWDEENQIARGKVDLIFPKVRHGVVGTRRARFYGAQQAIRGSDFQEPMFGEGNLL